jgi:hypothetical protein
MRKYCFFLLFIYLLPVTVSGQSAYFIKDSTAFSGIKLVDGGSIDNSRFCKVSDKGKVIRYNPSEVKEYGFKDGRIFKSFPVKINDSVANYFLERLVGGKVIMYYLRLKKGEEKFYLTDSSDINPVELLPREEQYRVILDSMMKDSPSASQNIPYLKLNKPGLIRLVNDYDKNVNRPFPRFQYGFTIGFNMSKFSAVDFRSIYAESDYNIRLNISVGAFADIPVSFTNFSFHPELHYKRTGESQSFLNNSNGHDLVINYSSLCLPLLLRYTIISNKTSPYFQLGPVYARAIRNKGALYEYEVTGNDSFINLVNSPLMQKNLGGFSVGSGFISKYGSAFSWFGELRYSKLYNLQKENRLLNIGEITIGGGLIF